MAATRTSAHRMLDYSPNAALFETVGDSAYDSLQVHVEKRLSHHFQAGVSYTWSHALDEQSDIGLFFTGNNPNNLRNSYASSDFDRTHTTSRRTSRCMLPNSAKEHSVASYFMNDWSLTGWALCRAASRILCMSSTVRWAAHTSAIIQR